MENGSITLDSAEAYNALYGLPAGHPSVAVIDVEMREGEFAPSSSASIPASTVIYPSGDSNARIGAGPIQAAAPASSMR